MSLRNYLNRNKIGGLILIIVIIIAFGFGGFGGGFLSNNQNNIAKINRTNVTSQDFIEFINQNGISQKAIQENLQNEIIEELLSGLISTTLLDLEIKDFNIIISENSLSKKIKNNSNFLDEEGIFQRIKYEKFLIENNISAPQFEKRLKDRELQKKLFDLIGAGTTTPKFLTKKLFERENTKLEIEFFELDDFYKKKNQINNLEIEEFLNENKDKIKIEYIDFNYALINPKNLIGIDEFNQTFFDRIDQIEVDISNNLDLDTILMDTDIKKIQVLDFRYTYDKSDIEKKIFEARDNKFDIIENEDDYILYKITKSEERSPNLNDLTLKDEILGLIYEKNKYEYNKKLIKKIDEKNFNNEDFNEMGKSKIQNILLNSIKDNKKFDIKAVELLYSLPLNSFTLINDDKSKIYLAKVKNRINQTNASDIKLNEYAINQNTNIKNNILKSYDLFLNEKYNVNINQIAINKVKNLF
tara:strand:+ start:1125 stop:2537 length:1413 start_codon:yes stop_codon:yes gene_type:complete